jgi:hypothetical protein
MICLGVLTHLRKNPSSKMFANMFANPLILGHQFAQGNWKIVPNQLFDQNLLLANKLFALANIAQPLFLMKSDTYPNPRTFIYFRHGQITISPLAPIKNQLSMTSLTFSTSCLSENGFGRKAKSVCPSRFFSKASSA